MKNLTYILILITGLSFTACEELDSLFGEETDKLTEKEVIEGLKTALQVGTDTAVTVASQTNGYYKDETIKVLLPEEVREVEAYMRQLELGDEIDQFIKSMNRAAEDAADEASPIFQDAITNLTISQGWDILNGINPSENTSSKSSFDSTAATNYLRSTTYNSLFDAFQPDIQNSLDKKLVGNLSTNEIWYNITTYYNSVAEYTPGWETINTDLDEYVTEKGLDGLFHKVGEEEIAIRRDPRAWAQTTVGDIFEKVFGNN